MKKTIATPVWALGNPAAEDLFGSQDMTPDEIAEYQTFQAEEARQRPIRELKARIEQLENTVTPRRLRDAILTQEGASWLAETETAIQTLRLALRNLERT